MTEITWTTEQRKLGDLIPWPRNPRQITKDQARRLSESLDEFGQVQTIAISPDNQILDGHQRQLVWAASEKWGPDLDVDVRVASRALTEKEREKLAVYLHKGAAGEWDFDVLANEFELGELLEWGFTEYDFQLAGVDWGEDEPPADPGPQVDRAEELQQKWQVQRGQVWEIGRHRLMCGDSTDAGDVGRLLDIGRIDCIVTDPPYGVDYDGGTTERERLSGDESPALYLPALSAWRPFCADHLALYLWYADGDQAVAQAVAQAGYHVRRNLIWNKNQAQYGALSQQYKQKHEPFLYCHLKGKSPYWAGDATEVTVWDIDRESKNDKHPTQKPPELFARAIRNSSHPGNIVWDGFLGSGTTLVACEQTNRIGYGMEIEPKYCAVTLERLTGMGLEARLTDENSETV